jgi:DNA-directed RNA polymerase specialized sigma24 family protein
VPLFLNNLKKSPKGTPIAWDSPANSFIIIPLGWLTNPKTDRDREDESRLPGGFRKGNNKSLGHFLVIVEFFRHLLESDSDMTQPIEDPILHLYRESFPDCARMIRAMGGTLEQAKDCFHDALLIYLEKKRPVHSSPRAYLLGTAKICWLQARRKESLLPLPEGFEIAEFPELVLEQRERGLLLSLQQSGRKCLELLTAFYYDRLSLMDISTRFGFNGVRSATVQKFKCLEKVREKIKSILHYA